jgi:predicted Zn-dependent protease with MMP-like domain
MRGMDRSTPSKGAEPRDERERPRGAAVRSDRERRRAEREVRRALSERRAVGTMVAAAACAHLFWFAVLAGDLRLAVVAGALGCVAFVAMSAHIEPAPPAGPKGEIARMSEPEFDRLLWAVERHGSDIATPGPAAAVDSFECLVREALDELPGFVRAELEQHVAVTVADGGTEHGAYGMYVGGTVANRGYGHQILMFRDTLERDFGHDPETLRRKVALVLRHEVAHHLGAGESHVGALGSLTSGSPRPLGPPAGAACPRSSPCPCRPERRRAQRSPRARRRGVYRLRALSPYRRKPSGARHDRPEPGWAEQRRDRGGGRLA